MSKRLLFAVLTLASLAMLLYVCGFVFWKLGIGLVGSALYWIAGKAMLLAFGLLLLLALMALLNALWRELRRYFSAEAKALRRLLSLRMRRLNAGQQLQAQTRQLRFWPGLKRKAVLEANNRKHLRGLYRAINADLCLAKTRLSQVDYQRMRKALRLYRRRADTAAMLALREQLPCP